MPLDRKDFAAAKPNKRALDADIEAELAAAMGAVDLSCALAEQESQQKPTPQAQAINSPQGRKKGRVVSIRWNDVFIDVPGGSTVSEPEAQMKDAFRKIATNVPPAKLLIER